MSKQIFYLEVGRHAGWRGKLFSPCYHDSDHVLNREAWCTVFWGPRFDKAEETQQSEQLGDTSEQGVAAWILVRAFSGRQSRRGE